MRKAPIGFTLAFLAAATAHADVQTDRLVPFDEFVQDVAVTPLRSFQGNPETRVADESAFATMRQHVLSLYQGVHVEHSFALDSQVFDCVPVMEQPSLRLLGLNGVAEPPVPTSMGEPPMRQQVLHRPQGATSPLQLGLADKFGNSMRCDDGTIPMLRVSLEQLTRFESLRHFFAKGPQGAGRPSSAQPTPNAVATHKYAHAYQPVNNLGGDSWLNLWNPAVNTGAKHVFSLSQHWYVGGSGAGLQTVESGWQVYPDFYRTNNAVTFIYWTADNYNERGCYNLTCPGFVQTNSKWPLGGSWSVYSTYGGTQYEFHMQWKMHQGNWWLFLQGNGNAEAVGYYPGSIYNGGQLSRHATSIDYGGETVGPATWPSMGSGGWSDWGFSRAAYQRAIFYIDGASNGQWSNLYSDQPSPSCYSLSYTPASAGSSWGTYFYFGGPGGTSC